MDSLQLIAVTGVPREPHFTRCSPWDLLKMLAFPPLSGDFLLPLSLSTPDQAEERGGGSPSPFTPPPQMSRFFLPPLPRQMVITASQIQWTTDVSKCLATCKERGDKKYLKAMKKKQVRMSLGL